MRGETIYRLDRLGNMFLKEIEYKPEYKSEKKEFSQLQETKEKPKMPDVLSDNLDPSDLDLSDFTDYRKTCLPIRCGSRFGIVCTFFHKDKLSSEIYSFYRKGLKNLIEFKKYIESEKYGFDVGPAYAVAAMIEDEDYRKFLSQFESSLSFSSDIQYYHVLQVRERGKTYHILPAEDDLLFGNIQQLGLIKFSVLQAFQTTFERPDNPNEISKQEINKMIIEWTLSNNKQNPAMFRNILISSKRNKIDGIERTFDSCIIYENLFETVRVKFEIDHLIQKVNKYKSNE